MRAAVFSSFGGPEVLEAVSVPAPQAGPGEVRVKVRTAGVQPIDCAVRSGRRAPGFAIEFPHITGGEFAGIVDQTGEGVLGVEAGTEVLGFRTQHTYAEYVVVPADQVVAKPVSMPWDVAGGLSGAGQAAHTAVEVLRVGENDTFLVNGAAGGVGTVAVQIARSLGATVIGTASEANHDYLRELGAIPVTYGEGLVERVRELAPHGVDAALDAASADGLRAAVELVKDIDRVGTITSVEAYEQLGARWIGSQRSAKRLDALVSLYVQGTLRIHVRATYPLEQAAEAHRDVESGHGRGKVVLTVG
ncbi:NADP-dependent oxidoreductase [Streptomyces sp. NL15-2K]|uniref:NADP-dependent oxidoreductase n=1 Tax=Streptomyces sp. NL15-2K TaxID=376149 RepID=UPI000F563807|nr:MULTISPECIES: NADP-dependent oxidoreductase [Actinomycetes]WKX10990.1 NADP-dependent oxidoreductase [Kutzneria buriramensis]GCB46918.1 bifunctional protein: zinc-containing alcohol dehydrogenase [Streptomyces sp. NL15-2K]